MKKIILSIALIVGFSGYVFWNISKSAPQPANTSTPPPTDTPTATPPVTPAPEPTPPPPPVTRRTGTYTDGTYTGDVTDAYFGNVQVKAIVANGRLADVQFLQYPNDRSTSVRINRAAMPLLTQEALQAQNAQVDIVSGATQTSEAFQTSLASALLQAKK